MQTTQSLLLVTALCSEAFAHTGDYILHSFLFQSRGAAGTMRATAPCVDNGCCNGLVLFEAMFVMLVCLRVPPAILNGW